MKYLLYNTSTCKYILCNISKGKRTFSHSTLFSLFSYNGNTPAVLPEVSTIEELLLKYPSCIVLASAPKLTLPYLQENHPELFI